MPTISCISRDAVRYRIVDNLALVDGDYLVLNDAGEHVFQINGKSLLEQDRIRLDDLEGNLLCQTSTHLTRSMNELTLVDRSGADVGRVLRHSMSPLRDRFSLETFGESQLCTEGDVSSLEFLIAGSTGVVAEVSRRWFRARNSYGIAIVPDQRDEVLLTGIVTIVQMTRGTA